MFVSLFLIACNWFIIDGLTRGRSFKFLVLAGFGALQAINIHIFIFWLYLSKVIVSQYRYKLYIFFLQIICTLQVIVPTAIFLYFASSPVFKLPLSTWLIIDVFIIMNELSKIPICLFKFTFAEMLNNMSMDYSLLAQLELQLQQFKEDEKKIKARFAIDSKMFEVMFKDLHIMQEIGSGGSGAIVYKAMWQNIPVALKLFRAQMFEESSSYDDFEHEVNLLASLRHGSIVTFYGACVEPPRIGIVQEFCDNGSLYNLISKHKRNIPWKMRLQILMDVAKGMNFLHSKNIIHRDLKSDNILLTSLNRAKISDFGISRMKDFVQTQMTRAVGTSNYMAPEVALGMDYDEKCDVFSYSIIMFELLAGTVDPYQGKGGPNVCMRVANNGLRPRIEDFIEVPEHQVWYVQLMKACWQHERGTRPTFGEIIQELHAHMTSIQQEDIDE
jgi:serine/threonine-protein kinase TNNI3K